jgi:hypothetical protein
MQPKQRPTGHADDPGQYEIRITGHLDPRWAAMFNGLALSHEVDGTTLLTGLVTDQAALHGLLQRVRDLGVPLVSVNRADPDLDVDPAPTPQHPERTDT